MISFSTWLVDRLKSEAFISKGKAQNSLFKPGPRDLRPKPRDVKLCGTAGGPGPCQQ
jgi:hypothetical protein